MTLFKFHFIVIFMYTMIFIVVLWEIPFRYDRIRKSPAEKKRERKTRAKRRARRNKQKKATSRETEDLYA